jgi:hypothetical protein
METLRIRPKYAAPSRPKTATSEATDKATTESTTPTQTATATATAKTTRSDAIKLFTVVIYKYL